MRGYDPERVLYFTDPGEITTEFFENEIDMGYEGLFSPVNWIGEMTGFFEKNKI
jgi:hypothetical protein